MLILCFRCIRFAVRSAKKAIQANLLNPIAETITSSFADEPHSCFLYLGSVLVSDCSACYVLSSNLQKRESWVREKGWHFDLLVEPPD